MSTATDESPSTPLWLVALPVAWGVKCGWDLHAAAQAGKLAPAALTMTVSAIVGLFLFRRRA